MKLSFPDSYAQYNERILCVCALHDCSTTSGIRTAKRNRSVGGAATSKHRIGWADDLVPDDMSKASRLAVVKTARALGMIAVDEGDHIHIQGRKAGPI